MNVAPSSHIRVSCNITQSARFVHAVGDGRIENQAVWMWVVVLSKPASAIAFRFDEEVADHRWVTLQEFGEGLEAGQFCGDTQRRLGLLGPPAASSSWSSSRCGASSAMLRCGASEVWRAALALCGVRGAVLWQRAVCAGSALLRPLASVPLPLRLPVRAAMERLGRCDPLWTGSGGARVRLMSDSAAAPWHSCPQPPHAPSLQPPLNPTPSLLPPINPPS